MPTLSKDDLIDRGMVTAVYAAEAPDRLAVISQDGQRTFARTERPCEPGAASAAEPRRSNPDRPSHWCARTVPEFVEVYEAVLRGGMRLTAINWHLTADEISYIVDDSEAAALIGDARFA